MPPIQFGQNAVVLPTLTHVQPEPGQNPPPVLQTGSGVGDGKWKVKFQDEDIGELFEGTAIYKRIVPTEEGNDLDAFLKALMKRVSKEIKEQLEIHKGLKGWILVELEYFHIPTGETSDFVIHTKLQTILNEFEVEKALQKFHEYIIARNCELIRGRSNLTLTNIRAARIKMAKYAPLAGRGFRPTPRFLEAKRCIVNFKNSDDKCLGYCIAAKKLFEEWQRDQSLLVTLRPATQEPQAPQAPASDGQIVDPGQVLNRATLRLLQGIMNRPNAEQAAARAHEAELAAQNEKREKEVTSLKKWNINPNRPSFYKPHFDRLGLNVITYPVDPRQIDQVENALNLKINIFSFFDDEGKGRYPLYTSSKLFPDEIDVLYLEGHYAWIHNFSGLMADVSKSKIKKHFCKG